LNLISWFQFSFFRWGQLVPLHLGAETFAAAAEAAEAMKAAAAAADAADAGDGDNENAPAAAATAAAAAADAAAAGEDGANKEIIAAFDVEQEEGASSSKSRGRPGRGAPHSGGGEHDAPEHYWWGAVQGGEFSYCP
jgi:hypothetical protein